MSIADVSKVYEYLLASIHHIYDGYVPYGISLPVNQKRLSLCKCFLCGNSSGGTRVYQDNGDTGIIESRFDKWLEEYPEKQVLFPKEGLINLLHILSDKRDKHGEVAISPSEKDWYDFSESYADVRNFAASELRRMGNPPFHLNAFLWVFGDVSGDAP